MNLLLFYQWISVLSSIPAAVAARVSYLPEQQWKYDQTTQQLTTGAGYCVTSLTGGSKIKAETIILGRPLRDPPPTYGMSPAAAPGGKSFALLFLNNMQKTETVTCDNTCLTKLGATTGSFTVTDVVSGQPHVAGSELDVNNGR